MNNINLDLIRYKYDSLKERNKELIDMKSRLEELETNEVIKEYNKLKKEFERDSIKEESDIIKLVFNREIVSKINTNIYVYAGAYMRDPVYGGRSEYICYDVNKAGYLLYINLADDLDTKNVYPSCKDEFESDKVIIKFNPYMFAGRDYYKIQDIYYKGILKGLSEEEILEYLEKDMEHNGINEIKRSNGKAKVKSLIRSE